MERKFMASKDIELREAFHKLDMQIDDWINSIERGKYIKINIQSIQHSVTPEYNQVSAYDCDARVVVNYVVTAIIMFTRDRP